MASCDSSSPKDAPCWILCEKCQGEGKLIQPASRKARKRHKLNDNSSDNNPPPPRIDGCKVCQGSGLLTHENENEKQHQPSENTTTTQFPSVAIIGGGLGGLALAVACQHRSIPCTVYERDQDFFERSQGYGLTMQQASRILASLAIPVPLPEGIVSTRHVVHTPSGRVVGEWGLRKWLSPKEQQERNINTSSDANNKHNNKNKRQNVHIARQSLRFELLKALGGSDKVQWGHKLVEFEVKDQGVDLVFDVVGNGEPTRKKTSAALVVGADGIRSAVRRQWLGEETTPLRYLGCIVILGICPIEGTNLTTLDTPLLDGETVFQTADGSTRIYMMPYSKTEYMWQLSFPMEEPDAKVLSSQGPQALKDASLEKCHGWHNPIVPILQQTPVTLVSGYPVYDRDLLTKETILAAVASSSSSSSSRRITLVGDAGHPMSPFKGQGANQALLDALSLARLLYKQFRQDGGGQDSRSEEDVLTQVIEAYEEEMLARSAVKVKASAEAAQFLHTEVAIQEGNITRGAAANATSSS